MTSNNVVPTVPRNNTALLKCGCRAVFVPKDGATKCNPCTRAGGVSIFGPSTPVEKSVVASILNRFGPAGIVPEILSLVQWDGLNGCYYFVRNGVYTGIETDGYMHQ